MIGPPRRICGIVRRCGALAAVMSGTVVATLDAQQLPPTQSRQIDSLFRDFADPRAPGCAVGVGKDGAPLFTRGYGAAVLEHNLPITPQAPPVWNPPASSLDAFAGTFYSDDVATAWQIIRSGDTLLLRRPARTDVPLVAAVTDLFGANLRDGGQEIGIAFVREGGRVVAFEVTDVSPYEIVRRLRFDRVR